MTMDRRQFLRATVGGAAGLAVVGSAGLALAAGGVRISQHQIGMALPAGKRLRVAHLTDIHVGWGTSAQTLKTAAAQARLTQPDLMVLTGDYLNHSLAEIDNLRDWVRSLPRPCVATLGNHDHWSGALAIRRMLEAEGIAVLSNENMVLPVGGHDLRIVGLDDGYTRHDDVGKAFLNVPRPQDALVLSHDPKTADAIARTGARLVVCGHTHGGQFDIPVITNAVASIAGLKYLKGWYTVDDLRLYVNAGVGSSVPTGRNGAASSELAIYDLTPLTA